MGRRVAASIQPALSKLPGPCRRAQHPGLARSEGAPATVRGLPHRADCPGPVVPHPHLKSG